MLVGHHTCFEQVQLPQSDNAREPPDLLDTAIMRMAEGPYSLVVVITDVALLSRKNRIEAGLASPASHVVVLSTRRLTFTSRREPVRRLGPEAAQINSAVFLFHLLEHIIGLNHQQPGKSKLMTPFIFQESRKEIPPYNIAERVIFRKKVAEIPKRELIALFLMVGALMMMIEGYVFPEDLINTWPTL